MDAAPAGTVADQGITAAELRLAARDHALPLEALRRPITTAGLHYLLIHYDIPTVDPATFRLQVDGAVERPLTLSLDDLRARERLAEPITFECARSGARCWSRADQPGVGRGRRHRRVSGTALAAGAARPARRRDRGVLHRARPGRRAACRSSSARCRSPRPSWAARLRDRRRAAAARRGLPLRLVVPGWYGMRNVK